MTAFLIIFSRYWQYIAIGICLIFIFIQASRIQNLKLELELSNGKLEEIKVLSDIHQVQVDNASRDAQEGAKRSNKQVTDILQSPVPNDCSKAMKWAVKQKELLT